MSKLGEKQEALLRKQVVDRENSKPFDLGFAKRFYDSNSAAKEGIKGLKSKGIIKEVDRPSVQEQYIVVRLPEKLADKWIPQ